jgi:hypothetical protein
MLYHSWLRHYARSRKVAGWSTTDLPGGKERPTRRAHNLTAIYGPIFSKMWDPRCLTTLWAYAACYRDNFTLHQYKSIWISWRLLISALIKKERFFRLCGWVIVWNIINAGIYSVYKLSMLCVWCTEVWLRKSRPINGFRIIHIFLLFVSATFLVGSDIFIW